MIAALAARALKGRSVFVVICQAGGDVIFDSDGEREPSFSWLGGVYLTREDAQREADKLVAAGRAWAKWHDARLLVSWSSHNAATIGMPWSVERREKEIAKLGPEPFHEETERARVVEVPKGAALTKDLTS